MKTPTFVVVVSLMAATLLAASLVIATGARGGSAAPERAASPASLLSAGDKPVLYHL